MAKQPNGQSDLSQMTDLNLVSVAELEDLLKRKKAEQSKLAALKGAEARKDGARQTR
jgi:hypothetical protein